MYTAEQEKSLFQQGKELLAQEKLTVSSIELIRKIINYADWKYYVQSESFFADVEYDKLFAALKQLEAEFPELITTDSPTQRIAKGLSEKFEQNAHLVPMLSLDNTYNETDLLDWARRCKEFVGEAEIEFCVEPKYDGASVSLIYEQGNLTFGTTRGDGIVGEKITTNIRQIRSIPLSIKAESGGWEQLEIRGEVVIHKQVFSEFNEQRIKEGLAPLANPRNAASGTLRMLDPEEVRKRKLSVVLYHVSHSNPQLTAKTHFDALKYLSALGFPTPIHEMKCFKSIEEVVSFCHDFEAKRDSLPFEIDGLVIKVNQFELQEMMGMTSHHPRWAVAYKFKARQATSKLRKVEFQVGRTGSITPVAKIDPVAIGGVVVSSISLFNQDVVKEKYVRIGDTVLVERAGDVIPYIARSIAELRDGTETEIQFPTHCPDCNQPLEKPLDEAVWRCINISCPSQVIERLIHFCSKDAMDIRGMGEANIKKFFEFGIIKDIPSIYTIDWDQIKGWTGFGEKSITNLKQAIEQSKSQPLNRLIFGLGIRHVGETTAKSLAENVQHINEFYEYTLDKLMSIEDIGPKVAAAIVDFFHLEENQQLLSMLAELGLNLANNQKTVASIDGALNGKTFLFTGTLSQFKRSDAEAKVEAKGGLILGGVSSKLNYLVVGADAGSKLEKAKKLGSVAILTEQEFLDMINVD